MKAGSAKNIAHWTFLVLMIISAAVLVMFYFVGFDNMGQVAAGMVRDPEYTDLLMYWMYALLGICVLCVGVSIVIQFVTMLVNDTKAALKGGIYLILLVALFVGSYFIADDATISINGKAFTDTGILKFTDLCIYPQYVLLTVTTVCTIFALLGVSKTINKIKA